MEADALEPRAGVGAGANGSEAERALAQVDSVLHVSGLAIRILGYVALLVFAWFAPIGKHVLTGVLAADVATRVLGAVVEMRFDRYALVFEVIFFAVIGQLWHGAGGVLLPDATEDRAIAMLGFLPVFAVRAGLLARRLMRDDAD